MGGWSDGLNMNMITQQTNKICCRCGSTDLSDKQIFYCRECIRKYNQEHYQKHRSQRIAYQTKYYYKNRDIILGRIRNDYQSNKERYRTRDTRWRTKHPEIKNAGRYRYKTRKINAPGRNFSANEWLVLCHSYNNKCLCCGVSATEKRLTPDHIKPLSCGGSNEITNIQPLCLSCNTRKRNREIDYRSIV